MSKMLVEFEWDDSLSKDFITLDYISKCMFRKEHISPFQADQVLITDVTNEVIGLVAELSTERMLTQQLNQNLKVAEASPSKKDFHTFDDSHGACPLCGSLTCTGRCFK